MQARALEERQQAAAHEAARIRELLDGGFVSPNEVEQKQAQTRRQRGADPGAPRASSRQVARGRRLRAARAVRRRGRARASPIPARSCGPGTAIVAARRSLASMRLTADVPEIDFDVVAPETPVAHPSARDRQGRSPARSRAARPPPTVDAHRPLRDRSPERDARRSRSARRRRSASTSASRCRPTEIPLARGEGSRQEARRSSSSKAASRKTQTFEVARRARRQPLRRSPSSPPGAQVVTEGRSLLANGDRVAANGSRAGTRQPSDRGSRSRTRSSS